MPKDEIINLHPTTNEYGDIWYEVNKLIDEANENDKRKQPTIDFAQMEREGEIKRLENKMDVIEVMRHLPLKILVGEKVYNTKLQNVKGTYLLSFVCRLDEVMRNGNVVNVGSEINEGNLPEINYKFREEDSAFVVQRALNDLIECGAVEISNNVTLEGNVNFFKTLEWLDGL